MEQFTFSNSCIDSVSEKTEEFLKAENVASGDIIRVKLMIEESLLKCREALGEDSVFSVKFIKRLGKIRIELHIPGKCIDPFAEDGNSDNGILRSLLAGSGLTPICQYKNQKNIIIFSPIKKTIPQILKLLIAVAAALILGGIFLLFPDEIYLKLSTDFITPLFDTMMAFLTSLAGIVIFLSLICGIINIGDITSFEKIGKKMITRISLMYIFFMLAYGFIIFPFFEFPLEGEGNLQISSLFQMILDSIKKSLLFVKEIDTYLMPIKMFLLNQDLYHNFF